MQPSLPAPDFLSLTLQTQSPAQPHWLAHNTRAHWLGHGLLRLSPDQPVSGQASVLLSAGIHGNETAPIEVLCAIVNDVLAGKLALQADLLVVLGNIPAMQAGTRFVDYDMNRLFDGQHQTQPQAREAARAAQLEAVAEAFFAEASGPRYHYDLHTAIRGSVFERFAIYPYLHDRPHSRSQLMWLQQAQIDTVLLHSKPAATYSYYTSHYCQADAFTLELGKARPFGHNELARFDGIAEALRHLLSGRTPPAPPYDASLLRLFRASHDLIKHSGDFRLHLDDAVENFTLLPDGMLIAEDGAVRHVASGGQQRILFPNPKVGVGLRAGIIIVPTTLEAADIHSKPGKSCGQAV